MSAPADDGGSARTGRALPPDPQAQGPGEVQKLPLRSVTPFSGRMLVYCPRQARDLDLDECMPCAHCIGLSLRDSYLVCGFSPDSAPGDSPLVAQALREDVQPLRPPAMSHGGGGSGAGAASRLGMPLFRFERPVVTVELGDSVLIAAQRMRDHHVGAVVVTREDRPIGILTDRDLVLRVVAERLDPAEVRIEQVVTYEATTALRTDGIESVVQKMRTHGVRRLPIVDDEGRVTGIVTADDLIGLLGRELAALGEAIEGNVDGSESR